MKIGIVGCKGRVGTLLVNEIRSGNWKGVGLSGGTVLPQDMKGKSDFFITTDAEELFKKSDAVIDFTSPAATRKHAALAAKHKKALIIGTTGLSVADEKEIANAAKKTTIVQSANFSVGVNVLLALVERGAATLDEDFDIEIFEAHHKNKVDSPSGTALALGKSAAKGRKVDLKRAADYARHGETGKRKRGKIGFSVARGGDVVGDHRVFFYGEGERVELSHIATNRSLYARGAIRAALWTKGKKPGLYSMKDILGL
ncbi:MAG: 4-hydroxy-tetrahydrodipicolinate reductase [Alphaproteobacteria bacterium PRO2]|nr:4-hydroxy-tetrahydrodipicolinate reductase [Alphaproteobacteria bacterium PRO2]